MLFQKSKIALLIALFFFPFLSACINQQYSSLPRYFDPDDITTYSFPKITRQLDDEYGKPHQPYSKEFLRRLKSRSLSLSQLKTATLLCLDIYTENPTWRDRLWHEVLYHLLEQHALSQQQLESLIQKSAKPEIHVKPSIRRNRNFGYKSTGSTVFLGKEIRFHFSFEYDRFEINDHTFRDSMKLLSNEKKTLRPLNRIGTGVRLTAFPKPEFFDTPTPKIANITYGFRAKAKLVQPEGYDPFMVQASASQQVKVVGHDDAVDEIITDESQRSLNESAWFNSRVVTSDKEYFVLLGFDNPPLAQAFTAWLLDGEQRYKLGQLFIPAHAPRQWYRLYRYRFIKRERWVLPEKVSVELVPDMTVVDKQLVHTAYWGKTMRRDHIIVDEPYKPAFNMDPVFADEVVNAVKISSLARFKSSAHSGETRLNVSVDRLHCRIAYQAIVFDDKQTYLDNMRLGFIHQKVGSESGHSTTIIIPNDVDQVHVRLIPADFWEIKGDLESPPWGYTLDFGILKLHDPKENRPRWLQGRVVWPDE